MESKRLFASGDTDGELTLHVYQRMTPDGALRDIEFQVRVRDEYGSVVRFSLTVDGAMQLRDRLNRALAVCAVGSYRLEDASFNAAFQKLLKEEIPFIAAQVRAGVEQALHGIGDLMNMAHSEKED